MDLNILALIVVFCADDRESVMDFSRNCFHRTYTCASELIDNDTEETVANRIATKCYYTKGKTKK